MATRYKDTRPDTESQRLIGIWDALEALKLAVVPSRRLISPAPYRDIPPSSNLPRRTISPKRRDCSTGGARATTARRYWSAFASSRIWPRSTGAGATTSTAISAIWKY